jgi:hypothetical protein
LSGAMTTCTARLLDLGWVRSTSGPTGLRHRSNCPGAF